MKFGLSGPDGKKKGLTGKTAFTPIGHGQSFGAGVKSTHRLRRRSARSRRKASHTPSRNCATLSTPQKTKGKPGDTRFPLDFATRLQVACGCDTLTARLRRSFEPSQARSCHPACRSVNGSNMHGLCPDCGKWGTGGDGRKAEIPPPVVRIATESGGRARGNTWTHVARLCPATHAPIRSRTREATAAPYWAEELKTPSLGMSLNRSRTGEDSSTQSLRTLHLS